MTVLTVPITLVTYKLKYQTLSKVSQTPFPILVKVIFPLRIKLSIKYFVQSHEFCRLEKEQQDISGIFPRFTSEHVGSEKLAVLVQVCYG